MKKRLSLIIAGLIALNSYAIAAVNIELQKAQEIDHLVKKRLRSEGHSFPVTASEHVFLRRAFVTAIGRIPTPEEAKMFPNLSSKRVRMELINYLYQHEGYNSHMTNWAMDLLRLRDKARGNVDSSVLIDWVQRSIRKNQPWDEMVFELLSSTGNAWVNGGASGYYAMDPNMQNDNLSATAFAFLGVKLECAQCHDDPFQEWERMDFYELSAFVNGGGGIGKGLSKKVKKMIREQPEKYDIKGVGQIGRLDQYLNRYVKFGISDHKGSGDVKLPKDWQYKDGKPGEKVYGRTPFGKGFKIKKPDWKQYEKFDAAAYPDLSKQEVAKKRKAIHTKLVAQKKEYEAMKGKGLNFLAEWITSDDTPQFAYTISARMWEHVMGFSLTETLGQYEEVAESDFPVLWEYLAQLIKDYDYDLKKFQRTLALTKTFQAETVVGEDNPALVGREIRRLSAEQIWDSLLVLISDEPENLTKRGISVRLQFGGYDIGPLKETVTKIGKMSREEYSDYILKLYRDIAEGKLPKAKKKKDEKGDKHLRRAADLRSPVYNNHFLYTFGQSDRSVTDGRTKEGSVSQALLLYNGKVQKHVVHNKNSALNKRISKFKTSEEKVRIIFQTVLCRQPTTPELTACLKEVEENEKNAYTNITSALISSKEFLFLL